MAAMRTTSTFLAAALCALAAACGGKSAPASTGPGNTGGAGDPAGGDAAKLVEAIGAMAVPEPCNNDDGTANLKDHLAAQREVLGGEAATDQRVAQLAAVVGVGEIDQRLAALDAG
jgi:hypothetical protein